MRGGGLFPGGAQALSPPAWKQEAGMVRGEYVMKCSSTRTHNQVFSMGCLEKFECMLAGIEESPKNLSPFLPAPTTCLPHGN